MTASTSAEHAPAHETSAVDTSGLEARTGRSLIELTEWARNLAADPECWLHRVRLRPDERWYERLYRDDEREAWLISWLPGQATGFHDHGNVRGAFVVALGILQEHDLSVVRTLTFDQVRGFGPGYVHDVRNTSVAPAVSVHVYSPPLGVMNRYERTASGLVPLVQESADDW
jgi:hypothetical protein